MEARIHKIDDDGLMVGSAFCYNGGQSAEVAENAF